MRSTLLMTALTGLFALMSCSASADGSESATGQPQDTADNVSEALPAFDFNADSAFSYIETQVGFGPRVPGSPSHAQCADWLAQSLESMGATVSDTKVDTPHPVTGSLVPVRNIFGQFNPTASRRILLLAHYDTRPWADEDPNPANRTKPIDGANDGASGVAVALEIARNAARYLPSDKGLDILFADYEDSGDSGDDDTWCIGSSYWAKHLPYSDSNRPYAAILLDMVGAPNATFTREYFSQTAVPYLNDIVWRTASRLGLADYFPNKPGSAINDDHIPLLRAGIPAIDIIDMRVDPEYIGFTPTWHTLDDNIDNIDPATLDAVGKVISTVIHSQL